MDQTFETPGHLHLDLRIPAGTMRIRAEETAQTHLYDQRGTEPRRHPHRVRRCPSGYAASDRRTPSARQALRRLRRRDARGPDGAAGHRRLLRLGLGRPGGHRADRLARIPQRLRRLSVRPRGGRRQHQGGERRPGRRHGRRERVVHLGLGRRALPCRRRRTWAARPHRATSRSARSGARSVCTWCPATSRSAPSDRARPRCARCPATSRSVSRAARASTWTSARRRERR